MHDMKTITENIHRAVRTSDYRELRSIVRMLVFVGACDTQRAQKLLAESEPRA